MCKNNCPESAGGASCRADAAIERRHLAASCDAAASAVQERRGPQEAVPQWQPEAADSCTAASPRGRDAASGGAAQQAQGALAEHAIGRIRARLRAV